MKTYGQYCPIARAAEIVAERWTPIILRNILLGHHTFNAIERGAPGISRTLLSQRLRELERHGIIEHRDGGYYPTPAGEEFQTVLDGLGTWGARWLETAPAHLDPYVALWSMTNFLDRDRMPNRRLVIRFEFPDRPRAKRTFWLLIEARSAEVCLKPPAPEDLTVTADSTAFVRWHMGLISWRQAAHDIDIQGPQDLVRAFPTWNKRSHFAHVKPAR